MDSILEGFGKKQPILYEAVGCTRQSSAEQITTEYRIRARRFHPDKLPDSSLRDEFILLQKAYNVLVDPEQRKLYDMWLDSPLQTEFDEFCRNSGAVKMSMHWVTPRSSPMITSPEGQPTAPPPRWSDGRYESETARRFRNYDI